MLTLLRRPHHHTTVRTILSLTSVNPVRDRALDHAVEKEHNLIHFLALKNLLKTSPSKSLPLSVIKSSPDIAFPSRPIDFIRKFPAAFEEHIPTATGIINPHVKLTPLIISLDEEEQSVLNSETHLVESAERVLKLVMIAGVNRLPLDVIQRLRFDLGLGSDFVERLIPNFPDYFRVCNNEIELVCKDKELSVSVMEQRAKGYEKGMSIEFPMRFSRGFEADKKFRKWVEGWQKLPYLSPYEDGVSGVSGKSEEGDKWVVAVLHEVLSLFYSKKTDRENLLFFGESLGLRTRFKQALLRHPGIFYVSRKVGLHTVVLRDGYKRDLLVEKHRLMDIRYKYIHLMNTETEDKKQKVVLGDSGKEKKQVSGTKEKVDGEGDGIDGVSGSEDVDDETENDYDDDDEEDESVDESDEKIEALSPTNSRGNRGRARENTRFDGKVALKTSVEGRYNETSRSRTSGYEGKEENEGRGFSRGSRGRTRGNPRFEGNKGEFGRDGSNQKRSRKYDDDNDDEGRKFSNTNSRGNRGRTGDRPRFEGTRVEFGRDRSKEGGSRNYDDKGREFSNASRGNRGGNSDNPRFDGANQRRSRSYEAKGEGEGRTFSNTNRGDRGRPRDSSRFEGKRDFKSSDESGRDGSYQRRTRNYEAKGEDGNRGNRGRTRGDSTRFEGKQDFKSTDRRGRDGSGQRGTKDYDSKREDYSSKRNDRGKSKESRYKESPRSSMEASA